MIYLYIDTSSNYLYSSIVKDNTILGEICEEYGQSLSKVALPRIVSMFEENNIKPNDITNIVVINGPGSFTGIRIGITIAKVFAWSLNIPITTMTSLEAMSLSVEDEKIHVPIINARRGYVYAAIYNKDKELLSPQHIKIDELKKYVEKYNDIEYISNDEFDEKFKLIEYRPNFLNIINTSKTKKSINPHMVNPEYLKLTAAEESKI